MSELLQEFRSRKNHIAIAVDESGGTSGLANLADILERCVYDTAVILSGFIFDINSMPDALQYLTLAIPARHFNTALQTVFLAGDIWPVFLPRMAFMLGLGAAFLVITYRKLVKRLDV